MKEFFTVDLYQFFGKTRQLMKDKEGQTGGTLDCMLHCEMPQLGNRRYPAALIIAGGAYAWNSSREGQPIASRLLAKGFNCFILNYSAAPNTFPVALEQLTMAMNYLRQNADKLHLSGKIATVSFSAGGHLALCGSLLATIEGIENFETVEDTKRIKRGTSQAKPDAMVLCYPVVSSGEFAHKNSFQNLCGNNEALAQRLSMEKMVSKDSPPAFIWHTVADTSVPVENSLLLADAYRKAGVPFELHLFEYGGHGLSTALFDTNKTEGNCVNVSSWVDLSCAWLDAHGFCIEGEI